MKNTENKSEVIESLDIESLITSDNLDDFNPTLALVLVFNKLINNFDSKDIIPKNLGKTYALISNTNKVQKDLIQAIIEKSNDNKGKVKKMYLDIIKETLKSIKNNSQEKESRFNMFKR
jgi:hypothetical protein